MLIGYEMQDALSSVTVTLTGAAWATGDAGAACFDRNPARKSRLIWPAGAPSIGQYVSIKGTFASPVPIGVVAALGLGVPVGTRVDFLGLPGLGLGNGCDNTRTVRMHDGSVGVVAAGDNAGMPDAGLEVRIFNDCMGETWATAGLVVDIGELVAMAAADVPLAPGWELGESVSMAERNRSKQGALHAASAGYYGTMRFIAQAARVEEVRHGALANGMDWVSLRQAMQDNARIIAIPRFSTKLEAATTGMYGIATNPGRIVHLGGDYYQWDWSFEEVPAQ